MVEKPVKRSYTALYVAMFVMMALLVVQLYRVEIVEGPRYLLLAQDNRERELPLKASRGIIYDRNGNRLVTNDPSYSVAVTAADVPDINCAATGSLPTQVQAAQVFTDLADLLDTSYVLTVRPHDLPQERAGEVTNRLSVLLEVYADTLRPTMKEIVERHADSQDLFLFRRDLPKESASRIKAELHNLPGIEVYNELQYRFIRGFSNCLRPVVVKDVDYTTMQRVEEKRAKLPAVTTELQPVRQYVDGPMFAHILGYVGQISREKYEQARDVYEPSDKIGQTGIEGYMEEHLRGVKGSAHLVVNSKERIVTQVTAREPITGNNVTLALDTELQKSVTAALQDGINKAKVKAGVAIVMRVDNGQVLSMVSLPSYDNNLFSHGISQEAFDTLNTDPALPMFNRAVGGVYPPGSTYKMITAAAALEEGVITPRTTFNCPGYIEVPFTYNEQQRNTFRDWRIQGHGVLNVVQALTVSSDVFFYIVSGPRQADRKIKHTDGSEQIIWTRYYTPNGTTPIEFDGLGIERLSRYANAFGLGQKTGIELPGESSGLSPDPNWKVETYPEDFWSMGDTLVTAIGQGFNLMTPLQLVNVTAAVANGGTLYQPQVVLNVTDPFGKAVQEFQPKVIRQVPVSPENLAIVRQGMRESIIHEKGTGHRITLRSIEVAGKTGTAEYGEQIAEKDGKEVRRSHAWFTAFAPYDKPEIAVVVFLEGGEESLEGSTYAVPVADSILKAYFKVNE